MGSGPILRSSKPTKRSLLIKLVRPLRPPPIPLGEVVEEIGIGARATVLVGLATVVNYVAWLGWDQTRDFPAAVGNAAYEPWQLVGLVLGLAVIAAAAGWRHRPWEGVIAATVVMALCVIVDGGMDPSADGLFIVDAFVAASHTFTIVSLVALVADGVASRKSPGNPWPAWSRYPWVWGPVMTVMLILNVLFWI